MRNTDRTVLTVAGILALAALAVAAPAAAHVHVVQSPHHEQQLANGQNHPPFEFNQDSQQYESCGEVDPGGGLTPEVACSCPVSVTMALGMMAPV